MGAFYSGSAVRIFRPPPCKTGCLPLLDRPCHVTKRSVSTESRLHNVSTYFSTLVSLAYAGIAPDARTERHRLPRRDTNPHIVAKPHLDARVSCSCSWLLLVPAPLCAHGVGKLHMALEHTDIQRRQKRAQGRRRRVVGRTCHVACSSTNDGQMRAPHWPVYGACNTAELPASSTVTLPGGCSHGSPSTCMWSSLCVSIRTDAA